MNLSEKYIAVRINVPSPLVGEGITAGQRERGRVRGTVSHIAMRRQPLTRLRFAKPPSPTGGEGKRGTIQRRQLA
jgi:hypothetical protein